MSMMVEFIFQFSSLMI